MNRSDTVYQTYIKILKRELVPAMGCTEPIALAYCAALAKELLGEVPERVEVLASGNIIKNVKSVVVPNTGGRRGIEAAAAAGIIAGDAARKLEVIAAVSDEQKAELAEFLKKTPITVKPAHTGHILDIMVVLEAGSHSVWVRITDEHTHVVYKEKDGVVVFQEEEKLAAGSVREAAGGEKAEAPMTAAASEKQRDSIQDTSGQLKNNGKFDCGKSDSPDEPDYSLLTVADVFDFAETADLSDVRAVLEKQIACNRAIAVEGLRGSYGANIGKTMLHCQGDDVRVRARACAAAASDARMNGCELPVVINSGSGNQGITASVPVLEYADAWGCTEEQRLRALLVSNLITLHLKSGIGRLSAYCGAVSAGVGAGAGIAYLKTRDLNVISHTIVNALAITSGIVCDGAKSSCAAKISVAVDAGIMGLEMYENGQQFYDGEGLVSKGVENTIRNIGVLGREGMSGTDKTIIEIMTGNC